MLEFIKDNWFTWLIIIGMWNTCVGVHLSENEAVDTTTPTQIEEQANQVANEMESKVNKVLDEMNEKVNAKVDEIKQKEKEFTSGVKSDIIEESNGESDPYGSYDPYKESSTY